MLTILVFCLYAALTNIPAPDTLCDAAIRTALLRCPGKCFLSSLLSRNHAQGPEYAGAGWKYDAPDDEVMVLHTLVVDPGFQGRGYAGCFIAFYEKFALENGCRYLRMDTNQTNSAARRLYASLGFSEPDIVSCVFNGIPDVKLVLLEKKL